MYLVNIIRRNGNCPKQRERTGSNEFQITAGQKKQKENQANNEGRMLHKFG